MSAAKGPTPAGSEVSKPKKRRIASGDNSVRTEKSHLLILEGPIDARFKIDLPLTLKKALVEDWENIVNQKCVRSMSMKLTLKLIVLPRNPSISTILDNYLAEHQGEHL